MHFLSRLLRRSESVKLFVLSPAYATGKETSIPYQTDKPKFELYQLLKTRLDAVLSQSQHLTSISKQKILTQLKQLDSLTGALLEFLPNGASLNIANAQGDVWVSIVLNVAYSAVNSMFGETKNRLLEEDTLSVVPRYVGSYPNAFYVVQRSDLPTFVDTFSKMRTKDGYRKLLDT